MTTGAAQTARRRTVLLVGAACSVGLALRLLFALGYWTHQPLTGDEREYLQLAYRLRTGHGLTYALPAPGDLSPGRHFARAPGYPAFLAVVGGRTLAPLADQGAPPWAKVWQSALGTLLVLVLAGLGHRLGGPRTAVIAAWIAAVHPPLVWGPAYLLSEVFYSALLWSGVLVLARTWGPPAAATPSRAWGSLLAGGFAGLAALTPPGALLFGGLGVCWLALSRPKLALVFALGLLVAIGPWTALNVSVHHTPILVAAQGGINFWVGNHPAATGDGDMSANPAVKLAESAFRPQHSSLSEEQLEPLYYQDAVRAIAAAPGAWLALEARKVFYFFVPVGNSYRTHTRLYSLASAVPYLLILPIGALGAASLIAARDGRAVPVALVWVSALLTALVFFTQERFRVSDVDPSLIVTASCWLSKRFGRDE